MFSCWRCSNKGLCCCCDHAVRSRPALSSWYLSALGTQPQPNVSRLCIWFSADHRSSRAPAECQWPVECWAAAELFTPADRHTDEQTEGQCCCRVACSVREWHWRSDVTVTQWRATWELSFLSVFSCVCARNIIGCSSWYFEKAATWLLRRKNSLVDSQLQRSRAAIK